ncbi:MAG: hypothetical protein EXS08_08040 [Planctomycetes bacterium]|nr:hypothetical protein [Planctomycetota bacterium]
MASPLWLLAPLVLQAPAAPDARTVVLAELQLTLTLPPLEGLRGAGTNRWRGMLGTSQVEIALRTLPGEKFALEEPADVLDMGPSFWSDPNQARNDPVARRALAGPFGFAAYASFERSELRSRDGATVLGLRYLLGGLLPTQGYWITLEATPAPDAAGEPALLEFLQHGIAYSGAVREHRWSDAEALARWQHDAPSATHEKFKGALRTAHYLILSNSDGGKLFAKKMEECYVTIQKTYPFDEVGGRRLLPVFLFQTADQYFEFYSRIAGIELEAAKRSKGHAWRDYYATWYEAPNDPVHIHEATHQIFANRLGLGGGGSWFQEGVAEYMSSRPGDRSAVAGQVKKQKHMPLARFIAVPSLLMSSDKDAAGGDQAGDLYKQAALLIEFLREGKETQSRFPTFLLRIGRLQRDEPEVLQSALEEVYGVTLAELEQRWVEYCKKR